MPLSLPREPNASILVLMQRRVRRRVLSAAVAAALSALAVARAPAGEPPTLPARVTLERGKPARARIELALASTFRSKDHRLRELSDEATLVASVDLSAGEPRGELVAVVASFRALEVERHFRARFAGFFSETEREGRGKAAWRAGETDPPPDLRGLLAPSGRLLADASPVTSDAARWAGEAWLDPRDRASDDDAKIRRLARYTALGTLLGAPALPPSGERRFEASFP